MVDEMAVEETTRPEGRRAKVISLTLESVDCADEKIRNTPNSWALLGHLIRVLPLPNAARMLNERKFMTILRQTLEEAVKAASDGGVPKSTSDIGSGIEDKPSKVSKKRKRSGELISSHSDSGDHVQKLPGAIFAAMHQMLRLANTSFDLSKGEQTTAFSTEYMKSVIRTPAEDAAKILGAWLSLCRISLKGREGLDTDGMKLWLSPFIEIWGCRTVGSEDPMQFSLHCSQSLLSLFKAMKTVKAPPERLMGEMEQLVARNIMIPAKAAKLIDADSDLLSNLTRISVIQDSASAPILFEVAVRSIQAHGSRRRRPNDESWLQNVFSVLKDAMPPIRAEENGKALREMLLSATKYKVALELSILRSITLEYCLLEEGTDWALLATIIKLDANVFLIKPEGEDLAQQVLTRITAASLRPTWSELSVQVVSEVLVPLMISFASARELSSFVRHWHTQLVEFRKARTPAQASWMALFSAWEDEHLQAEFFKIMEPSLTVFQISQLLDWLSSQSTEYPDATCVILEAMAGSISQEEVVDAVGLRIFHIMFDNKASKNLDARYKWRSWRILSRIVTWIPQSGLQEISALWEEQAAPFDALSSSLRNGTFLDAVDSNIMELERLEMLRCACAVWNASQKGTKMAGLTKKPVLDFLRSLLLDRKQLRQLLTSDMGLAEQDCRSTLNTLHPGACWMLRSSFSCVVVEFPAVLG
jgi:nucleolar pre-ribosomal-associated protein 2